MNQISSPVCDIKFDYFLEKKIMLLWNDLMDFVYYDLFGTDTLVKMENNYVCVETEGPNRQTYLYTLMKNIVMTLLMHVF